MTARLGRVEQQGWGGGLKSYSSRFWSDSTPEAGTQGSVCVCVWVAAWGLFPYKAACTGNGLIMNSQMRSRGI